MRGVDDWCRSTVSLNRTKVNGVLAIQRSNLAVDNKSPIDPQNGKSTKFKSKSIVPIQKSWIAAANPGLASLAALLIAPSAFGSQIRSTIAGAEDTTGLRHLRVGYVMGLDDFGRSGSSDHNTSAGSGSSSNLTGNSILVALQRDSYLLRSSQDSTAADSSTALSQGPAPEQSIDLSLVQTWNKTGETRASVGYSGSKGRHSKRFGFGISEWLPGGNIRVSADGFRNLSIAPRQEILDYDSEIIASLARTTSSGVVFGLRHLASPTAVIDYNLLSVHTTGRPLSYGAAFNIKQFLPRFRCAVEANVTRSYNRGEISTNTTYGSVDAWSTKLSLHKHLWTQARGRIDYRYYRENETTRALQDRKTIGSDTVALGLAQDIGGSGNEAPFSVGGKIVRYMNNASLIASALEASLTKRF